jgi:hypothetical protein
LTTPVLAHAKATVEQAVDRLGADLASFDARLAAALEKSRRKMVYQIGEWPTLANFCQIWFIRSATYRSASIPCCRSSPAGLSGPPTGRGLIH